MSNLKIIKHGDLEVNTLISICSIKSFCWNYNLNSQQKWIEENVFFNDYHCLLYNQEQLVAYSNLVNISVTINNKKKNGLGVGNVCSLKQGQGYGGELVNKINAFLIQSDVFGLLFCNEQLIQFYSKYSWITLSKNSISFLNYSQPVFRSMIFNTKTPVNSVIYSDRIF